MVCVSRYSVVLHLLEPTLHRGSRGCQDNASPPSENIWRQGKGSEGKKGKQRVGGIGARMREEKTSQEKRKEERSSAPVGVLRLVQAHQSASLAEPFNDTIDTHRVRGVDGQTRLHRDAFREVSLEVVGVHHESVHLSDDAQTENRPITPRCLITSNHMWRAPQDGTLVP